MKNPFQNLFRKRSSDAPEDLYEERDEALAGLEKRLKPNRQVWVKRGLVGFFVVCLGILAYDIVNSDLLGGLTAETPVVNLNQNELTPGEDAAEPGEKQPLYSAGAAGADEQTPGAEDTFYAEYRLEREQTRATELELIAEILDDPEVSADSRTAAEARKLQIATNIENELLAESLLKAKDFGEVVVLLGDWQATIVISGELDELKAGQAAEIVDSVTRIGYENINIIPR